DLLERDPRGGDAGGHDERADDTEHSQRSQQAQRRSVQQPVLPQHPDRCEGEGGEGRAEEDPPFGQGDDERPGERGDPGEEERGDDWVFRFFVGGQMRVTMMSGVRMMMRIPVTIGSAKIVPRRMDAASPKSTVAATSAAVYQFHWDTASTLRRKPSTVTAAVIAASRTR